MADFQSTPTHLDYNEAVSRLRDQFNSSGLDEALVRGIADWSMGGKFESPVEHLFGITWDMETSIQNAIGTSYSICMVAQRQVTIGDRCYRPDFVFYGRHREMPGAVNTLSRIAVEIDGHEFHERTKQQVTYRNQRDRDFQAAGWKVFHFSGSEVWKDPALCVFEVWKYCGAELDKIFNAWVKQHEDNQSAPTRHNGEA